MSGPWDGVNVCHFPGSTAYLSLSLADLKKTLAVLLDNIMLRLGKLEAKVDNIYNGTGTNMSSSSSSSTATPSATNAEKVNVAG